MPQELTIYWLAIAVLVAADSYRRYVETERRAAELNSQLAAAELAVLRMQLQPHFLFNTLHAISTLVDWRPADARRMITLLSQLLRETLDFDGRRLISLEEELEWTERYLEIERIRFEDRLTIEMHADPETFEARVPPFILQPLVENAMKHGVATTNAPVTVTIDARRLDGQLRLSVADDGGGPHEPPSGERIGLENTRRRLATLYGGAPRLALRPRTRGYEAIVELPFTTIGTDGPVHDPRR
jgi:LytS/YehU family sensor histidine kinase